MLNKIIKTLLVILFFSIPLINSHLFNLIGINWGFYVEGNYEFSKLIFFNILSGIILTLFFIELYLSKNKLIIPKIIFPIVGILILSTLFSDSTYTSLLGNTSKGHSLIMFLNLIGLFILFTNLAKSFSKKLIITAIISSIFIGILGVKEYYFPTFNYGNLSNRAISTFGHPNYLALYVLIIIPFLIEKIKNNFYKFILILLIFTLFLTKSIWAIFILLGYLLFKIITLSGIISASFKGIIFVKLIYSNCLNKRKGLNNFLIGFIILICLIILIIIIYKFGLLTKLNSFFSRFYIWETTLNIIFSNIKNFLFGSGLGSLEFYFDIFKSPELYIFENIGYTADRPHNLFLNFFYHFGIFGLIFILFLIYKLFKNYKNNHYFHSIVLFLLFTIFNFPSISHYLLIILVIAIINNFQTKSQKEYLVPGKILLSLITIISIFGIYFSYNYYLEEHKKYLDKNYENKNYFIKKVKQESKNLYKPGVNHYFYIGDNLWNINKTEAIKYYKKGLEKLPDMWNKNSKYYDNYFVNKLFIPERFYSEKFSNLKEILKRVGEK